MLSMNLDEVIPEETCNNTEKKDIKYNQQIYSKVHKKFEYYRPFRYTIPDQTGQQFEKKRG
jgi:hypothetical protein